MTLWALVLLVSAFLITPGLAVSGLDPESADLDLGLSEAELLQDNLLAERWNVGFRCTSCKKTIQKLENMVGTEASKESISQAASQVCGKMGLLKVPCRILIKTFLKVIVQDIMAGKSASEVCVDIKMCKSAGLI
ncbi:granulysin [Sorex fumeus]|uniref:granulysin n=1 Tax=Sorex fumeus TaxID=62283 RepID=UPI0024AD6EF2|nr:granulysin [Sorex fumeus]